MVPQDTWPDSKPNNFTNELANITSDVRERYIVSVLDHYADKEVNILMTLGASHYFVQEKLLESYYSDVSIKKYDDYNAN